MAIETLAHLGLRFYLAFPLMVLGGVLAIWGAKRGLKGLIYAVRGDPTQLAPLMEGFRATMIGLALVGVGTAWLWHLPLLLILSLAIGGGETLETSLILFALRHGSHLQLGPPAGKKHGQTCDQTLSHRSAITAATRAPIQGSQSTDPFPW
jgi:hypothetical protein